MINVAAGISPKPVISYSLHMYLSLENKILKCLFL